LPWVSRISPETAVFVVLSFEGPDPYSQAVDSHAHPTTCARRWPGAATKTHLFFVGDPSLPNEERRIGGRYISTAGASG